MPKEYLGKKSAYLAVNALTVSRSIASLGVALTLGNPVSYALAGYAMFSDFIDGKLARKLHVDSFQGGIKDNLADLAMYNATTALALVSFEKLMTFLTIEKLIPQFPEIYDKIFAGILASTLLFIAKHHTYPQLKDALRRNKARVIPGEKYEEWIKRQPIENLTTEYLKK